MAILLLITKKSQSQWKMYVQTGMKNQYVTSPNGETLGKNVNVRRSERIIKYPQRYNPGFGDAREWKNDSVASIVYMIQDRDFIAM